MVRSASLATLALLAAAPPAPARAAGADLPPEPGVYWEQQVEMQMTGFSMPAQTSKVCLPKKGLEEPPKGRDDGKCKMTDVTRSGSKMTWKLKCEDGTTGEGELTSGPDSYTGNMTMRTQGQEMRMKMTGKKVGGDCDAAETKRKVAGIQKQVADAQADHARAQAETCADAADKMDLRLFVPLQPGLPVPCADSTRFCANLETKKGLVAFKGHVDPRGGDPRKTAEKLCKKDLAAIEKKHCDAAAKEQEKKTSFGDADALEYVFAYCPDLAKTLAKRECKGRSYTSLPRAQREFCTRWAEQTIGDPEAEPPAGGKYMKSGIPDAEDAQPAKKSSADKKKKPAADEEDDAAKAKDAEDVKSKIFKGIFGR